MINQLSQSLQNIIIFNYEMFMKFGLLLFLFAFSLIYLFYYKPNIEKKTPFVSVMMARVVSTALAFFTLVFAPILLIVLDPRYSFNEFITIYFTLYLIFLLVMFILMMIDFIYWGFAFVIKIAGVDINSEKYGQFKRWVDVYLRHKY